MANEELEQRGYLPEGKLKGRKFGSFEELDIGKTSIKELVASGVAAAIPSAVSYPFKEFKPPKRPEAAEPDTVYVQRITDKLFPVAVAEHKRASRRKSDKDVLKATEQALFYGLVLGAKVAITYRGNKCVYVNVDASSKSGALVFFDETRDWNPAVLQNLLAGDATEFKDPKPLAETVWQIIWHATKAEPKECLLTFVEIFVLKFLSDNLPKKDLPDTYSFYYLNRDSAEFLALTGLTAIEYYVSTVRPKIKTLFPDNQIAHDPAVPKLFGLNTIVSKTSVINGFAFLKSSSDSVVTFNRTFLEILSAFDKFGSLTSIDPEFKLRLYETFLRSSAKQQKLGQFFTPRNVVKPIIKMANLAALPDGAVVLDPAAGVGGFILEPLLLADALQDNIRFHNGTASRRVTTVGIDLDTDTHILAKANMLIHMAEAVRDPSTTVQALNRVMANTFVMMNENQTLGALFNPPREVVDVIMTNPPYVTQGSGIYRKELAELKDVRRNGVDLRDYYDGCGLGLESLFLRYIAGALKPGGTAFVIVPLGLLNRTEPKPKAALLKDCNLVGSIQLPSNTFFNTSQKTYLLVLEKRHTDVDDRPDVFCGIARSIGESLDWRRIPLPKENDLGDIADSFVQYRSGKELSNTTAKLIKIIPASKFGPDDRWDVLRFWTDQELVRLGEKDTPMSKEDFIEQAEESLEEILGELRAAREELAKLEKSRMKKVSLNDNTRFVVRSGTRIKSEDVRLNPGKIPVYSCFKTSTITKGTISERWLKKHSIPIETSPVVTVNANGASVGKVYFRDERCVLTDDVIVIDVLDPDIDPELMSIQLQHAVTAGGFLYEAKLFQSRVRELEVAIPFKGRTFDLECQKRIAAAQKRFDTTRRKLAEIGMWSDDARIIN